MRVAVCGDSFMAVDPLVVGKHFSEMLNFEVSNYAHPGVGNIDICFQIKQAISDEVDYVLIGTTDPARLIMPIDDVDCYDISHKHLRDGADKLFHSTTIPTFIGDEKDLRNVLDISKEQRVAVKQYFLHIFNTELNSNIDRWCLGYWYHQLQLAGIKYKILNKDFCIYTYKQNGKTDNWSFHTDFETQACAADILNRELAQ